jgi:hypothetical protein
MSHGPRTFKQQDMTRALLAAKKAGVPVARVEVDKDGKIVVIVGKPEDVEATQGNEWDEVYGDTKIQMGE